MRNTDTTKEMPLYLALIPILITGIGLAISVFVIDAEPHFALFLGATVAGLCAYWHGYSWKTIREGFKHAIARTIPSLIILLIIGMLISVWIASGIVPALMFFGFEFLVAQWFLPLIMIFSSFMSLITGSSWSTVGTLGVAAIGVSEGLGIPVEITAGVVVSGAFFGDKLSPMSDSTNLTPSVLGVNLFDHIRHMLYTTVPSWVIALIIYTIIGFTFVSNGDVNAQASIDYSQNIRDSFNLSPWLFIAPLAVIGLIVKKVPAIPSLIAGLLLGGLTYIFVQGGSVDTLVSTIHTGFVLETGTSEIDELFSRGGMTSMYDVVSLALISLALGGIMDYTGMLRAIVRSLARFVKTVGNLTITVMITSIFVNIVAANQYLAVIIPGQMYEKSFRDHKLKLKNLTRALEASGTLTAPLIPWNSSGIFVYSTLGISAAAYAPYAIVCWLTTIIMGVFAYSGITMHKLEKEGIQEPEDQQ